MVERHTFLIEAQPLADVVLRVLAPFAVQGAQILAMEAAESGSRTSIRIDAARIDAETAGHLVERLRAMPAVVIVGLVWRAAAAA